MKVNAKRIWEHEFYPAHEVVRSWQLATGRIWGCRFSPDGKTLIITSNEKVIRFWDVPSGKPVRAITNYPDIVGVAVVLPVATAWRAAGTSIKSRPSGALCFSGSA